MTLYKMTLYCIYVSGSRMILIHTIQKSFVCQCMYAYIHVTLVLFMYPMVVEIDVHHLKELGLLVYVCIYACADHNA